MNILIVDDEPLLTNLVQRVLEQDGWGVTVAHSLLDAKAQPGPFDAIVADVRLPNGDGRHLKELHPGIPFITMSGLHGELPDLPKPFSPAQLKATVYAAVPDLDRRGLPREGEFS